LARGRFARAVSTIGSRSRTGTGRPSARARRIDLIFNPRQSRSKVETSETTFVPADTVDRR
jgi:hypothetical protein